MRGGGHRRVARWVKLKPDLVLCFKMEKIVCFMNVKASISTSGISSTDSAYTPPLPSCVQVVWPHLNPRRRGRPRAPRHNRPGQKEMRSRAEMVNANLNGGGNVIISKSAEPSRPGVAARMATLHPERVGPRDRGHDCQSHPEDLCPPPPNSVSTCGLIKVWRIVGETGSKSMSWLCGDGRGGWREGGGVRDPAKHLNRPVKVGRADRVCVRGLVCVCVGGGGVGGACLPAIK